MFPLTIFLAALWSAVIPPPGHIHATNTFADAIEAHPDSSRILEEHFGRLAEIWKRAYNEGDSAGLAALYAPDAKYISSHVAGLVADGRDRLIANFQRGIKAGGHIDTLSILSIQVSCDLATLLCKYEATNNGQKAIGRNLLVVKRVGSKWLITLHMTVV